MIRPSVAEDTPSLSNVINAVELFPGEMLAEMMEPYLSSAETAEHWLTFEDGAPRGVAYFIPERLTDRTWNLLLIAVHPDQQGKGHGAALLRSVEAKLAELGGRMLIIETSGLAGFEAQRGFYRKCGYEEEARIRDFYEAGNNKVVFRKVLV
jgi:ribosomal protein S18 acetylase RimI-like enzyme